MLELEEIYKNTLNYELEALVRIYSDDTNKVQADSDKRMLWYYNENYAIYALCIEKNINHCKQHFYRCARIDEYLINICNSRLLDSGVANITYALLSDNLNLINRYAMLSHPWYSSTIKSGSLTHAMQNIIKEDWESLKTDIATYESITTVQRNKLNIPDLMFFKGILAKDEVMITEAINNLLKDHKKRNKHMRTGQNYISIPALGYTKLAWLKGFEIEIDHPLIPKALLPFKPLDEYDDRYDFLKNLNKNT